MCRAGAGGAGPGHR